MSDLDGAGRNRFEDVVQFATTYPLRYWRVPDNAPGGPAVSGPYEDHSRTLFVDEEKDQDGGRCNGARKGFR